MATSAMLGKTTQFKRAGVKIAEVTRIGGPNLSADQVDVTNMDSTGGYREFITGLKDGGEITLDFNFIDDSTQQSLANDLQNDTLSAYSIVWPFAGTPTWTFSGLVTAFSVDTAVADAITGSATIKISGSVTLA